MLSARVELDELTLILQINDSADPLRGGDLSARTCCRIDLFLQLWARKKLLVIIGSFATHGFFMKVVDHVRAGQPQRRFTQGVLVLLSSNQVRRQDHAEFIPNPRYAEDRQESQYLTGRSSGWTTGVASSRPPIQR